MAHIRRPAVLAGWWMIAAWLSFISFGCTAHPLGTPIEAGLVDERLRGFLRYQRAIDVLTVRSPEVPPPRRRYETLRTALSPGGLPRFAPSMPGPQGFGRLRRTLVAQAQDPALLAGYLQHQYRRLARSGGEWESRRAFAWQWAFWGRAAVLGYRRTRDPWFLEWPEASSVSTFYAGRAAGSRTTAAVASWPPGRAEPVPAATATSRRSPGS